MRLLLLCLIVAAVAGCGDSGEDADDSSRPATSATTAPATGDAYARRVDALCREANPLLARTMARVVRARDAARAGEVSLVETFATFQRLLRQAGATTERFTARLREIDAPAAKRAFHASLVRSAEESAANLRQQVAAAERRDSVRLRELSINGTVIAARRKGLVEGQGGFRHCGRG